MRWACGCAPLLALGCGDLPPRPPVEVDCAVTDRYELAIFRGFDSAESTWFSSDDETGYVPCGEGFPVAPDPNAPEDEEEDDGPCLEPGHRPASASATVEALPEGDRCGSQYALRLQAERNNDWGAIFGDYDFSQNPVNGTGYEGIALWARSAPRSDKVLTLILDDRYTAEDAGICEVPDEDEVSRGPELIGQPGVVLPGAVPSEDACGNGYQRTFMVSEHWKLYLLPFNSFSQDPLPNRRFEGPDVSALYGMTFRAPKEMRLDIWIDDIAFYRRTLE